MNTIQSLIQKLFGSRKWLLGLIATIANYILLTKYNLTLEQVLGINTPLVATILGESYVDAKKNVKQ